MFIHFFKLYLNLFILMSFPRRWWGKLFHSLKIVTKKECLKTFTLADFIHILTGLFDLVLLLQYSKQSRHSSPCNSNTVLQHSTKEKYSLRRSSVLQPSNSVISSYDISRRFCPKAILDALRCMLSMASLSLTRQGDHTGLAYSNRGLTSYLQ